MSYKILSFGMDSGPSLGIEFESKDEHDDFILENIMMPCMGSLNLEAVCFHGDKEKNEKFLKIIFLITEILFKANSQRRQYLIEEKRLVDLHFQKSIHDSNNPDVELKLRPVDLVVYVDGVLSNVKATLDTFTRLFNLLFELKIHGWHKKRDGEGNEVSGLDVIKKLKSISNQKEIGNMSDLIGFIDANTKWISYLVKLRDDSHHYGGIRSIGDIVYNKKTKIAVPPTISHPYGENELLSAFINRTIIHFNIFINTLLVMSLQARTPFLVLQKVVHENGAVSYHWGIPKNSDKAKDSKE